MSSICPACVVSVASIVGHWDRQDSSIESCPCPSHDPCPLSDGTRADTCRVSSQSVPHFSHQRSLQPSTKPSCKARRLRANCLRRVSSARLIAAGEEGSFRFRGTSVL